MTPAEVERWLQGLGSLLPREAVSALAEEVRRQGMDGSAFDALVASRATPSLGDAVRPNHMATLRRCWNAKKPSKAAALPKQDDEKLEQRKITPARFDPPPRETVTELGELPEVSVEIPKEAEDVDKEADIGTPLSSALQKQKVARPPQVPKLDLSFVHNKGSRSDSDNLMKHEWKGGRTHGRPASIVSAAGADDPHRAGFAHASAEDQQRIAEFYGYRDEGFIATMNGLCTDMIRPRLYVGNMADAAYWPLLKKLGITHVINCSLEAQKVPPAYESKGVQYLLLPWQDREEEAQSLTRQRFRTLRGATQYMKSVLKARDANNAILVHCVQAFDQADDVDHRWHIANDFCISILMATSSLIPDKPFGHLMITRQVRGLGRENPNLAGLLKTGGALATLYQASRLLSRTALQVRRRPLPIVREKQVVATKRLPLWQLSDEMYMQRQVSPDPSLSWTEVRRAQARMKEQVMAQQYIDFRHIERELGGFRLQPRYHISELRAGMWLEGRVSRSNDKGVMVDVGAYTEQGEWVDGFLHMGQIKDDGGYVPQGKIMDFVHLGEYVRVRVVECVPSTGILRLSMRAEEDLPELFMGKPRPYSVHDIEKGMQVTGIIRRVWDKWALVDIGCDRLARIHAREHPRERNEYGFYNWERVHKYAWTAYPRGAQMEFWVEKVKNSLHIDLVANRPPSTKLADKVAAKRRTGEGIQPMGDPRPERLTREQLRDREKSEAEKATWSPYVAHVDEWLEDAAEPDDETDSWVARTERELFEEWKADNPEEEDDRGFDLSQQIEEDFEDADDFGEDEFAEDDFADDSEYIADDVPFSLSTEEDGKWELEDSPASQPSDDLLY